MIRTESVAIKLTLEDVARLTAEAAEANMPLRTYMRGKLLAKPRGMSPDTELVLVELGRLRALVSRLAAEPNESVGRIEASVDAMDPRIWLFRKNGGTNL